jgi:hypothetical protein
MAMQQTAVRSDGTRDKGDARNWAGTSPTSPGSKGITEPARVIDLLAAALPELR